MDASGTSNKRSCRPREKRGQGRDGAHTCGSGPCKQPRASTNACPSISKSGPTQAAPPGTPQPQSSHVVSPPEARLPAKAWFQYSDAEATARAGMHLRALMPGASATER
jgi:hypothetical protein